MGIVGLAVAGCATTPLAPGSTAATMQGWGLVGTWADDCSAPASFANIHMTYRLDGNNATMVRDFGTGHDESPIVSAAVRDDGTIVVRVDVAGGFGVFEDDMVKDAQMRTRAMNTHSEKTGVFTIRDGTLASTGQPSVWTNFCR